MIFLKLTLRIHFMTPKEKFYLKYLSSYSKKCDFRKFPPIRGEISPRGSMSPNMQILYVPNYTPYFESCTIRDMDFRKCRHFEISLRSRGKFPLGFLTRLNIAHLHKEHAWKKPCPATVIRLGCRLDRKNRWLTDGHTNTQLNLTKPECNHSGIHVYLVFLFLNTFLPLPLSFSSLHPPFFLPFLLLFPFLSIVLYHFCLGGGDGK